MKKSLLIVLIILFLSSVYGRTQVLFINEIMSSNNKFYFDEDGDDSDWIEIYNNSGEPVNLEGYCLSDKSKQLCRWSFPDTSIQAYHYLIVFASNKNRAEIGKELHTNFAIAKAGEDIFLSYGGEIVHMLPAKELETNTSYGLFPDGNSQSFVFVNPTPGEANFYQDSNEQLQFSHEGGIYENTFNLEIINPNPEKRIFYTTDGSTPTAESLLYESALVLDSSFHSQRNISQILITPPSEHQAPDISDVPKAIIIKAAYFDENGDMISDVTTHSYFFKSLGINHNSLPIISISADYDDLFDESIGILVPGVNWDSTNPFLSGNYMLRGDTWEREAYAEFYESNNQIGFKQKVGLRTHGTSTRRNPQKGLKIYARSKYGLSKFNYKLFDDRKTDIFNTLIFKPFTASWNFAGAEDYICNKIVAGLDVDGVASRPAILYLNGEYWGIYYISERIDEEYLETYHDIDPNNVDIIGDWQGTPNCGDNTDYLEMYEFVKNNDFSVYVNYNEISKLIDINNFIDYQIFQIYVANYDWPANNFRCWRSKTPGSKWRFAFYDGDACLMNYKLDMFERSTDTTTTHGPTHIGATLIFRKLMENEMFCNKFFARMEDVLNQFLYYQNTFVFYNIAYQFLEPEITTLINRFSISHHYVYWIYIMDVINEFLEKRSCTILEQVYSKYGIELDINGCVPISVDPGGGLDKNPGFSPNPSNGNFRVDFTPNFSGKYDFFLINLFGEKINLESRYLKKKLTYTNLYRVSLSPGIYYIVIQGDKEYRSGKIIIINY
ncbi:MAG: CotH kinase family protein [Candidatus Kapabacteria bacterium]|nr:CotH kinase family protein [Candidatus Kapabacteria bacterium]